MSELFNWSNFLHWLSQPGGISIMVGIVLSIVAEYVPQFGSLAPRWKRLAFFGVSILVPLLGAALGVWTDGWSPAWRETFWPALLAGVLVFASGTMTHLPKLPGFPSGAQNP